MATDLPLTPLNSWVMLNVKEESGLYEIPDDLLRVLPDATASERLAATQNTLTDLVSCGMIELYMADWLRKQLQRVGPDEVGSLLAAESTWRLPSADQSNVVFAAFTDAGLAAWLTTPWRQIPNLPSLFDN